MMMITLTTIIVMIKMVLIITSISILGLHPRYFVDENYHERNGDEDDDDEFDLIKI